MILDYLKKNTIIAELASEDKKGVLEELSIPAAKASKIDKNVILRVLMEREKLGTTGIGNGIALPHGKLEGLESMFLGLGLSRKGVAFDSMDGEPAHIFFTLLTPENSTDLHLKLLAKISKLLKSESFRVSLMEAADADSIFSVIKEAVRPPVGDL